MAARRKKTRPRTKCRCYNGWVCANHPNQPWGHSSCEAAGDLCTNPRCDKDLDSIFLSARVQTGRRKPPVRKTSLARDAEQEPVTMNPRPHQSITCTPSKDGRRQAVGCP